ncbi:ATG8-interacting protein 1-like [Typha angustifolia]|uniref:ATG8-interacting protein 1-like n=1 Tax=Typha angustifolia TaxID=59011 RepID=UPI003C2E2EE4
MTDNKKEAEEISPRGNDWEVVSLTASTYAASPGPKRFEQLDENKDSENVAKGHESSDAMFMSSHFLLPTDEHTNLLVETDCKKVQNEVCKQDVFSAEMGVYEAEKTCEESCKSKSDDELHGIQFFDKEKSLSIGEMEFGDGKTLQGLNLVGEEQVMLVSSGFESFHVESEISRSVHASESVGVVEPISPCYASPDSPVDSIDASVPKEDDGNESSDLPCEAWWKRQAVILYNNAKEANTFWSVFVAAALVGIVVLGKRWQRERLHLQQIKLQFDVNNEKVSFMMGPFSRFKSILIAGNQRTPLIRGDAAFGQ